VNVKDDGDIAKCVALARRTLAIDAPVTVLCIGAVQTVVAAGRFNEPPVVFRIPIGHDGPGWLAFGNDTPTPLALEHAIAEVEDAIMPLARHLPRPSTLVGVGGAVRTVVQAATPRASGVDLSIQDLEALFEQMAAVSQGRPSASSGVPAGAPFAATLLILRETMHHLGFDALSMASEPYPPRDPSRTPP